MKTIGMIAGEGRFPFLVAQEIKKTGDKVFIVALKDEADKNIESVGDETQWFSIGKAQKIIDAFKSRNINTAIMVGRVKHAKIYSALSMDLRAIKFMAGLVNKKTDTILGAVVNEFKKDGIDFLPSHIYLKHLLAQKGLIVGKKLNSQEQQDVEFGSKIAKGVAGLDIGQTVVVKDRSVLAVESIEGTNECIRRAYSLGGENSIVIKVAKPNQDFRFDVPVIGTTTIDVLKENKVRAMAIEAGSTLILDKEDVIQKAIEANVTIIGF